MATFDFSELPLSWNIAGLSTRYRTGLFRLLWVGDSIAKMADTRLTSGLIRTWTFPQGFNGGLINSNNNGTFGFDNIVSSPAAATRAANEFDDGVAALVGTDPYGPGDWNEWYWNSDPLNESSLDRFIFNLSEWQGDGNASQSWAHRADFKGRVIYLQHPQGLTDGMALRPYINGAANGTKTFFSDYNATQSITWFEHSSGHTVTPTTNALVEFRLLYANVAKVAGNGHVVFGLRKYLDDATGFEMGTLGAGSSTPANWADPALYTDAQLGKMLEACESNVVFLFLGANSGGDKATFKANMTTILDRIEAAYATFTPNETPWVVLLGTHDMGGARATADWAEASYELAVERENSWAGGHYGFINMRRLIIDNIGNYAAISSSHMTDEVHPNQTGADAFMSLVEGELLNPTPIDSAAGTRGRSTLSGRREIMLGDRP